MLADVRQGKNIELHQRADLASMNLASMIKAIHIALETIAVTPDPVH